MLGILEGRTSFDIDIHKVKLKVTQNEKRKKMHGFSFKNIKIMANYEKFLWSIKSWTLTSYFWRGVLSLLDFIFKYIQ